jgi:hypothetical protein
MRLKSTTHDEPGRHGAIEHGMGKRIWRISRTRPTAWLRTSHGGNWLLVAIRSTDTHEVRTSASGERYALVTGTTLR